MGRFDFIEDDFNGFVERGEDDCKHAFDTSLGVTDPKCLLCGKTREELRKKW